MDEQRDEGCTTQGAPQTMAAPTEVQSIHALGLCTIAREKLAFVIAHNRNIADACERVLNHINDHPEIDKDLVKVFQIQPPPVIA